MLAVQVGFFKNNSNGKVFIYVIENEGFDDKYEVENTRNV